MARELQIPTDLLAKLAREAVHSFSMEQKVDREEILRKAIQDEHIGGRRETRYIWDSVDYFLGCANDNASRQFDKRTEEERIKRIIREAGQGYTLDISSATDLAGATTLVDGGSFYRIFCNFSGGINLELLAKRYTNPRKFLTSLKIQQVLQELKQRGMLQGIDILPVLSHDMDSMILVQPYFKHGDYRKEVESNTRNPNLEVLSEEINRIAIVNEALSANKDSAFLRDILGEVPNALIPETDYTEEFLKIFALRGVPELEKELLDENGRLVRSKVSNHPELLRVMQAYEEEFLSRYQIRNRTIVNKDSHLGNILLPRPADRWKPFSLHDSVYIDWECMALDILEDPIAELVTSVNLDDPLSEFDPDRAEWLGDRMCSPETVNVPRGEFLRNLQMRITEKYLRRAGRYLSYSKSGVVSREGDREALVQKAEVAYSSAIDFMDFLGLRKTREALERFNERYAVVRKVPVVYNCPLYAMSRMLAREGRVTEGEKKLIQDTKLLSSCNATRSSASMLD